MPVGSNVSVLVREDLAFALAIILMGMLVMITRRNAVTQIVGFMSLENGLVLAATGAKGMPLVVEFSVAFSILIAFIVFGVFVFRIRERFDTVDVSTLDQFRGERESTGDHAAARSPADPRCCCGAAGAGAELSHRRISQHARRRADLHGRGIAPVSVGVSDRHTHRRRLQQLPGDAHHFRRLHNVDLQRELHRPRARNRPADPDVPAFLSCAVSGDDRRDERGAYRQQRRPVVGGRRGGDALDRDDGRHLSHAGSGRGGVEILHPRFGWHCARVLRHHPGLSRGAGRAGRGPSGDGLGQMAKNAGKFDPKLLSLAFVFLLVGYGTKIGLAPFHAWLPDAHAEGPTPISAVLSGLLLNVALYALLRFKMIMAGNPKTINVGLVMIVLGLVSLVFAAFMLYRRRDIKRLFAYSSIEHMGIMTFAFGMGGPLANFAGLLHMTMHALTKSAIFFAVGHIAQVKGSQRIADIKGLSITPSGARGGSRARRRRDRGLPPFGVFTSEFMLVSSSFARQPWLALVLVFGLIVGFGALILRLQDVLFGEPSGLLAR